MFSGLCSFVFIYIFNYVHLCCLLFVKLCPFRFVSFGPVTFVNRSLGSKRTRTCPFLNKRTRTKKSVRLYVRVRLKLNKRIRSCICSFGSFTGLIA
ncbi:hypothetical protein Hanom_Chr05g00471421 [Helianthus anomalus]